MTILITGASSGIAEGKRQPIAELTEALSGTDEPDLDFDVLAFGEGVDVP